jgi:hypothetical protein
VKRDQALRAAIASRPGPCHLCGSSRLELEGETWVADHLLTQYEGGPDHPLNMAKAHSTCNRWRGSRPLSPEMYDRVRQRRRVALYVEG